MESFCLGLRSLLDPQQIIELAKEIEAGDPIDWSDLPLHRDAVYNMLGLAVLERAANEPDPRLRETILLASIVKLTVENFVLEMRLRHK